MRNIITLADTTPKHTYTQSPAHGGENYVSKLKINQFNKQNNASTSQQLDDLLFELSKEAGFKSTKSYNLSKSSNRANSATSNHNIFTSNYNNQDITSMRSASTIPSRHHVSTTNNSGYYSDFEAGAERSGKNVIDLEINPKKGRVYEKVTTRHEYVKEDYTGSKQQNKQHSSQNNHAYSSAIHKSVSGNDSGVSHKYYEQQGYGEVNVPPAPPPRKYVINSSGQQFNALNAFNSSRKGRFETTNTDSFSPPLEVKDIQATARSLEDKWESRKRDNKSVDRLAEKFTAGLSSYQKNRSGSLDIDLDDLVQRNLTKKASKSATLIEEENQKAAYYISGIERPAVRTKNLPHTKYIFKICSPERELQPTPTFSSHITIPEPPAPEPEPIEEKQETEVISLEPIGPGVQLLESEGSRDGRASNSRIITKLMSTSNQVQDTPNYQTTTNYAAYESQTNRQPFANETMNQALENYASYKKSETIGGFPNLPQQQNWMQQYPFFFTQPVFIPFNNMGTGVMPGPKEYKETYKYTETHHNVPPNSIPPSPLPNDKYLAITAASNSQMNRQLSVPITIETNSMSLASKNEQAYSNQRSISRNSNRNYVVNTPTNNNTISGYSFSETKHETNIESPMLSTNTPSSNHYHPNAGSPETVRSWTVSPGSSIKMKEEMKTEVFSPNNTNENARNDKVISETSEFSEHDYNLARVKDTAKIWHRPHITRAEAVTLLKNKPAGSFIVRNSQSYSGGYGLALKVNQLPPNVEAKGDDFEANFVRHFLIESSTKGVKLKGCSNEPVFGSLSGLIHQHTITPLSLPCKLLLPEYSGGTRPFNKQEIGSIYSYQNTSSNNVLRGQVIFIESMKTESPNDQEAFEKAIKNVFTENFRTLNVALIDMKISEQGIVLTDNKHKSFFRRHYPLDHVSFCGVDPFEKPRTLQDSDGNQFSGRVFGFIAKNKGASDNSSCHLFMEFEREELSAAAYLNIINHLIG